MTRRILSGLPDRIVPLGVLAVVLAGLVPSRSLSAHSDWLLAALVLLTAVQIDPRDLLQLQRRLPALIAVSVGALLANTALAWLESRLFTGQIRDGVLSLGLASTEVASVGLIGLAGADTVLALGILTVSLVSSAILGPLLAGALAHPAGHGGSWQILGRFALAVMLPLIVGLVARGSQPRLRQVQPDADGLAALAVCALLFAAISGVSGGHQLLTELLASVIFIAAAGAVGASLAATLRRFGLDPTTVAFTTTLRDFAVAATLAREAFGADAAGVGGVYGAAMLLAGAVAATVLRRRQTSETSSRR